MQYSWGRKVEVFYSTYLAVAICVRQCLLVVLYGVIVGTTLCAVLRHLLADPERSSNKYLSEEQHELLISASN